jgi:hypothetical protein
MIVNRVVRVHVGLVFDDTDLGHIVSTIVGPVHLLRMSTRTTGKPFRFKIQFTCELNFKRYAGIPAEGSLDRPKFY